MGKTAIKAAVLCAAVMLGAVSSAFAETQTPAPNVVRMTADGDTFSLPSNTGSVVFDLIQTQPYTTGTLYQILNTTTDEVIWETTSTETRPVSDAGTVVTAVGTLAKISEPVSIQLPPGAGIEFNTTAAAASGFTGIYLYRRVGGVK